MINRYLSDVSHIRSHHWKYWLDVYQHCGYDCQYCVYRTGPKMGKVTPVVDIAALADELTALAPGILYLGPQADIYQPREAALGITRKTIELLCERAVPVFTVTRSLLILRDLDVMQEMAKNGRIEVSVTIASAHENSVLEPNTPSIAERLDLIRQLTRAGVTVSVHMSPILPGVDDAASLIEVMSAATDAGAQCIYACVLAMAPAYEAEVALAVRSNSPGVEIMDYYPRSNAERDIYSAHGHFIADLMTSLADLSEGRSIPFACVHIPELDNVERNGGIFRFKVPTIGDICRHFRRRGTLEVRWSDLCAYLGNFEAVDQSTIQSFAKFWNEGSLFKNTYFHPAAAQGGQIVYRAQEVLDFAINNMKVTAAASAA